MKIKLPAILTLMLSSALMLAACGNSASTGTPTAQSTAASASVSSEAKLALGIMELSGTEQDITATQDGELLTLWQAYQALSDSDTAAQVKLEAVTQQIQDTLTADQIQAIDDLQISAESMAQYMGSATTEAGPAPSDDSQSSGSGPDGGTPPDGEMMGDMGMAGTSASIQTASDSVNASLVQTQTVSTTLLSTLIQMLETRVQTSS